MHWYWRMKWAGIDRHADWLAGSCLTWRDARVGGDGDVAVVLHEPQLPESLS